MRTTSFKPPYPESLGEWLAAFRHRATDERGNPMSPERLGKQIGVSGATIRRWESGRLRPSLENAAGLATACNLTPAHIAFLNRALRGRPPTVSIEIEDFANRADNLLRCEFPTYILDSLLYMRAWNSYLPDFLSRTVDASETDYHLIDFVIEAEQHANVWPSLRERVWRVIIEFWFMTAEFCDTEEYRRLVQRLSMYEVFQEQWQRIAFLTDGECHQIGMPRRAWRDDIGESLICPFVVLLPPTYQVRQFIPVDSIARQRLATLHENGPARLHFAAHAHWAPAGTNEGVA